MQESHLGEATASVEAAPFPRSLSFSLDVAVTLRSAFSSELWFFPRLLDCTPAIYAKSPQERPACASSSAVCGRHATRQGLRV